MQTDVSLPKLLRQRGHEIVSEGKLADIFLPKSESPRLLDTFEDILFNMMCGENFRKSFRDWAYGNDDQFGYFQTIESYVTLGGHFDREFKNVGRTKEGRVSKYSNTFEWFISELMCREFGAKSSGFHIRLADTSDDEFDCLAIIDDGLVFIECKTGENVRLGAEVKKFTRRDSELAASYSFFLFDRDYTFSKDRDDIPDIKSSEAHKLGLDAIEKIHVAGGASFYAVTGGGRIFLASSGFKHLKKRLRHMMRYTTLYRDGGGIHTKAYKHSKITFAPG